MPCASSQFDIQRTVHRDVFLYWKPTRCTISQIYLIKYSTCFGQVHCPSSGVSQHCVHSNKYLSCYLEVILCLRFYEWKSFVWHLKWKRWCIGKKTASLGRTIEIITAVQRVCWCSEKRKGSTFIINWDGVTTGRLQKVIQWLLPMDNSHENVSST